MNMDSLNKWLTLAANLGVIAGILFLGVELQQNSNAVQSQTRADIAQELSNRMYDMAHSELLELVDENKPIEEYSGVEQQRVGALHTAGLRMWENVHYQYRKGLYEDSEFFREREAWKFSTNTPLQKSVFCISKNFYSEDFVLELESLLNSPC